MSSCKLPDLRIPHLTTAAACRWRFAKNPQTGEFLIDEFGEKIRESNARMVKWSDGT